MQGQGPGRPFDPVRDAWSREATPRLFRECGERQFGPDYELIPVPAGDRLDTEFGTDFLVKGADRNATLAARLRGKHYLGFGDVTLRYDSLQTSGRLLEVASGSGSLYWYAIADTDRPSPPSRCLDWYLIRYQEMLTLLRLHDLRYRGPFPNADESSRLIAVKVTDLRRLQLIVDSMVPHPVVRPQSGGDSTQLPLL